MRFSIENAVLLVIDVQGNLAYKMHSKDSLFKHLIALIHAAQILKIPILQTEQKPEKIGETIPEINDVLEDCIPFQKSTFSCYAEASFQLTLENLNRREVIISGIESHVCVWQTVADLIENNYQVQVVADATSSRSVIDHNYAMQRMQSIGATITTAEMLMTELLRTSEHPNFKKILKLIR